MLNQAESSVHVIRGSRTYSAGPAKTVGSARNKSFRSCGGRIFRKTGQFHNRIWAWYARMASQAFGQTHQKITTAIYGAKTLRYSFIISSRTSALCGGAIATYAAGHGSHLYLCLLLLQNNFPKSYRNTVYVVDISVNWRCCRNAIGKQFKSVQKIARIIYRIAFSLLTVPSY